jgi:WD40 repeat protein
VLAGTPVPIPQEPITLDNVNQIRELAIWGKGRIEQLAYSPDGKILAVGTTAGVWLYDSETLAELRFINTGNFVGSLAFTEDGTKLVVDSGASTVSIWDVATGNRLSSGQIRDGYQGNINYSPGSVAFSPGATILAATLDEQKIGLWADQGETYLHTIVQEEFRSMSKLVFSPDHKLLALKWGDLSIQLWDVTTGNLLHTLESGYELGVTALTFSPQLSDGGSAKILLAASGTEGPVKLWDAQTGILVKTLDEANAASALSFSPDGKLLAMSLDDGVRLWRIADNTPLYTLTAGPKHFARNLAFSPDSKILTSGSPDGTVQRWNTNTGTLIDKLEGFGNSVGNLYSVPFPLPAFWSENKIFISNPFNNQIELWNLKTGERVMELTGHNSTILNLVISKDGSKLASTEEWTNTLHIWDSVTGQNLGIYKTYIDIGYGKELAISPNGQLLAIGDARARNRAVYTSTNLDNWLYQLPKEYWSSNPVFSTDGQKIGWFPGPTTAAVSKAESGELLHNLETGDHDSGLTFSPDSQELAVGTREGRIQLWDAATGILVTTLNSETSNQVTSLAYSPDEQILAAGMQDVQLRFGALTPTIWLWDVKTGTLLKTIEGYQANVIFLSFSPDGTLLATASLDGTMRLWGIPPE